LANATISQLVEENNPMLD
jgi:hypothetical protein